jgi:hypothetical protein
MRNGAAMLAFGIRRLTEPVHIDGVGVRRILVFECDCGRARCEGGAIWYVKPGGLAPDRRSRWNAT